ncbi:MAG: hypothetical protein LBJ00_11605 [Planctomycetaceae bacterium]|nr:hypothetical protein [Planctomycetaceae bacterium]
MSIVLELFFCLCSQDIATVLVNLWFVILPVLAVSPIIGMVAAGDHSGGCACSSCGGEGDAGGELRDIEPLKRRVAELESMSVRSIEQSEELADIFGELATIAYDEGQDLETIVMLLNRAEQVLKNTLAQGEETEIRRKLGNVYLHRAVAYNDYDDLDHAIESYNIAFATLKPLDDSGDGEAKYDIAGIQLNRGTIYHEKGDFQKAKTDFDESFLAFRAVEKISDLDTRYFMAKVSVAQGTLFRDMEEPLDKVVDAYNRAMRLLVELIDIGQMEHERELANVLMDRCTATYESYQDFEFESETERLNKIGDVLIDVGRGIEILDRIVNAEPQFENRVDLFNAVTTEGSILLDIGKFAEAIKAFDRAINEFGDFATVNDPILLLYFASALSNRSLCYASIEKYDEAIESSDRCIKIIERLQQDESLGLEENEKEDFQLHALHIYANRSRIFVLIGDKKTASKYYEEGLRVIEKLRETLGEDIDYIAELYVMLRKQIDSLPNK